MSISRFLLVAIFSLSTFSAFSQMPVRTNISSMEWAPDGKAIFITAMKFQGPGQPVITSIYQYDMEKHSNKLLIAGGSYPSVSPDGKRIVFVRYSGTDSSRLYLYDIGSMTETPLSAHGVKASAPDWSGNGKFIVYNVNRGKEIDIRKIDLASGEESELIAHNGYKNYNPVVSPLANTICFYLEKGDKHDQIYITDENGSLSLNVTNDTTTHNFYPSWYSSTEIIYTQFPNGVFKIRLNGGTPQKLSELPSNSYYSRFNARTNRMAVITSNPNSLIVVNLGTGKAELTADCSTLNIVL